MHGLHIPRGLLVGAAAASTAAVTLVAVSAAPAADPQVEQFVFGPTVTTSTDFCGTGKTVIETFSARVLVWLDPNQPVDTRNHSVSDDVLTSPSTGVTVTTHAAFGFDGGLHAIAG